MNDTEIERLWDELGDIPFIEDEDSCLVLDVDHFHIWVKGTDRDEIWHWFDKNHSKGVYYLLEERENHG